MFLHPRNHPSWSGESWVWWRVWVLLLLVLGSCFFLRRLSGFAAPLCSLLCFAQPPIATSLPQFYFPSEIGRSSFFLFPPSIFLSLPVGLASLFSSGVIFLSTSHHKLGRAPFGTVSAEITSETIDFFVSDAEGDPDCPTPGFSSIDHALLTLRHDKFVIVVDDEDDGGGEVVEGNLVMAAAFTTAKHVVFMMKHGSGIVSVGMMKNFDSD